MLRHCSRLVTLVLSTKRSKVSDAGAGGHKLVSDVVPTGSGGARVIYVDNAQLFEYELTTPDASNQEMNLSING